MSVDDVCAALDLSVRAVAALVESGLLRVVLVGGSRVAPSLDAVRFRADEVARLVGTREVARRREAFPARTVDFDRASAWGALLGALD